MREPTHEEMVEGIRKAVYDAIMDQRDFPFMPKTVVTESIAQGVKQAFEGRDLAVLIEHAVRGSVEAAVRKHLADHPDALKGQQFYGGGGGNP